MKLTHFLDDFLVSVDGLKSIDVHVVESKFLSFITVLGITENANFEGGLGGIG